MIPRDATVAFNPLQWFATSDGWLDWQLAPPWAELMAEVKRAGFDFVHTRIPEGFAALEYGAIIRDAGLEPAPGTLGFGLPEEGHTVERTLESVRSTARGYSSLGFAHVFVLAEMNPAAPRVARPAVGAEADDARLERIVELLAQIGEAATAEGVLPILHPHVGTWIETAEETRYVLDRVDPSLLGFGPDVGHLSWAGANPSELVTAYSDRVYGVHIKDLRRSVRDDSLARRRTYTETVGAGLWTEPGRGDFDYDELWGALGSDFGGTIVVEVDKGDLQPAFASARASAGWVARQRAA
ncbi:MAG: xylose isomerase [Microbacteriaceae bacterium]|nr:MAG: xylose isomerase [Microbacteriaceae bacterium]